MVSIYQLAFFWCNVSGWSQSTYNQVIPILKVSNLKDTGEKHPKIKLQPLRKIRIWTFGSLVHQINSLVHQINFLRGSKTGTNFSKN